MQCKSYLQPPAQSDGAQFGYPVWAGEAGGSMESETGIHLGNEVDKKIYRA